MKLSRRSFIKLGGGTAAAAAMTGAGFRQAYAVEEPLRLEFAREYNTTCTFCGVGCGIICHVRDGVIVNMEGDPDHPVNEGTLCSKGSSYYNVSYVYDARGRPSVNPQRVTRVKHRKPGARDWGELEWDEALDRIAARIKETRDEHLETTSNGVTVNRNIAINWIGSAFCTNEENYLFHKMARSLGIMSMEHCARL